MSEWSEILDYLERSGLRRRPVTIDGPQGPRVHIGDREFLCFCSNNYLDLANHPDLIDAATDAARRYGTGTGASRLVSGSMTVHHKLEEAVARLKRTDAALLFPTGYMANLGTIPALVGRGDTIFCDRLNHASVFDGCRLASATLRVYPHRDADALDHLLRRERGGRTLVVTDSVFSMDGDLAPLPDLLEVCERHGATLMIDEAHATGVMGATGRGAAEHFGIEPGRIPVLMGTLSKAVGSIGGYVAGSTDLIDLLLNRARSFIYTTAPPPPACAAAAAGLRLIQAEPQRRTALWERTRQLHDGLRRLGLDIGPSQTPITPVIVGDARAALALAQKLLERGILAPAIRPPTVPEGSARIRITPMATHTTDDVAALLDAIA